MRAGCDFQLESSAFSRVWSPAHEPVVASGRAGRGEPPKGEPGDEGHGAAGDLPAAEDQPAGTRGADLPVSASRPRGHAGRRGVVRGCDLHPDGARVCVSGGDHGLENAGGAFLGSSPTHWTARSAWKPCARHWKRQDGHRRSSTPIRAASSQAVHGSPRWKGAVPG